MIVTIDADPAEKWGADPNDPDPDRIQIALRLNRYVHGLRHPSVLRRWLLTVDGSVYYDSYHDPYTEADERADARVGR